MNGNLASGEVLSAHSVSVGLTSPALVTGTIGGVVAVVAAVAAVVVVVVVAAAVVVVVVVVVVVL